MLPMSTLSRTSPAVRTTKMSPRPTSKIISGGTRESEQLRITAKGFCSFVMDCRRVIKSEPCGALDSPATNLAFPSSRRVVAASASTPPCSFPSETATKPTNQMQANILTRFPASGRNLIGREHVRLCDGFSNHRIIGNDYGCSWLKFISELVSELG